MKVLRKTNKIAELLFSIDELFIIRNSLSELYEQDKSDIFVLVNGDVSKEDMLQLIKKVENVISRYQDNLFAFDDKLNQISKDEILLSLEYESLSFIKDVLGSVTSELERNNLHLLCKNIKINVLYPMRENRIEYILYRKILDNKILLKVNRDDLIIDSTTSRVTKRCDFEFVSHLIILFLSSYQNRLVKLLCMDQIRVYKSLPEINSPVESKFGLIGYNDLVSLISYLELVVDSNMNDEDLKEFIFLVYSSYKPLFSIQVVLRTFESNTSGVFKLKFRLDSIIQNDVVNENYIEIEDTINTYSINSFNNSIREFIHSLPRG